MRSTPRQSVAARARMPSKVVTDDALYFTDNGRIVCGRHCGTSAQYTGRDISGQKIKRVSADAAAAWLTEMGEPIACEDCRARLARQVPCDKCDQPNDRAAEGNYCTRCAAEYQARIQRDPEQRPVGSRP